MIHHSVIIKMRLQQTFKFLRNPHKSAEAWRRDLTKHPDLAYTLLDGCANLVNRTIILKGPLRVSAHRHQKAIDYAVSTVTPDNAVDYLKERIPLCRFIAKVILNYVEEHKKLQRKRK